MERLRNSNVLSYPHPSKFLSMCTKKMKTATISYLNIVKWTLHLSHFGPATVVARSHKIAPVVRSWLW